MGRKITKLIDFIPADGEAKTKYAIVAKQTAILGVVVVVYLLNRLVFRNGVPLELPLSLVVCYLPDLMAPIALFSASNIAFALAGFQLRKLLPMVLFCIIAAFVWELIAPIIIPWSITDPYDMICYLAGGILYWLLNRLLIPMNRAAELHR